MIQKIVVVFVMCCYSLLVSAQIQPEHVIDFRQRLLHLKQSDDLEVTAVDSFRTLHLMIAGNIYQTEKHLKYAYDKQTGKYDFKNELKYVQPILNLGDICIANLKTSFGNDVKNM